jgi:hypothetical protein
VETHGGPFILLPWNKRAAWEGADPPSGGRVVRAKFRWDGQAIATDYDEACDASGCALIRRKGFDALAIEMYPKTWLPRPHGGILVHWESGPSRAHVESLLRKNFGPRVRKETVRWKKSSLRLKVPGKLVLFDASYPGRGAPAAMRLMLALRAGTYTLSECNFRPDDETSLTLRRFTKT